MKNISNYLILCLAVGACGGDDMQMPAPMPPSPQPTAGPAPDREELSLGDFLAVVDQPAPAVLRSGGGVAAIAAPVYALTQPGGTPGAGRLTVVDDMGAVALLPGPVALSTACPLDRPAWTPGGDRLLCNTGAGLVSFRIDGVPGGAAPRRHTSAAADRDGAFSPEGRQLAYSRLDPRSGKREIFLDGTPLTNNGGNSEPAWAPDGGRIAFSHRSADDAQEILTIDVHTRQLSRLTTAAFDSAPAFSPDGRRLAFVRRAGATTDVRVLEIEGSSGGELAAADADSPSFTADGRLGYRRPGVGYVIGSEATAAPAVRHVVLGPQVPARRMVGPGSPAPEGVQGLLLSGGAALGAVVLLERGTTPAPRVRLIFDSAALTVAEVLSVDALSYQPFGAAPPPLTRLSGAGRAPFGGAYLVYGGVALTAVVTVNGQAAATASIEGGSLVLRGTLSGVIDAAGHLVKEGPLKEARFDLQGGIL